MSEIIENAQWVVERLECEDWEYTPFEPHCLRLTCKRCLISRAVDALTAAQARIGGLERQLWATAEGQRATLDQLARVTSERDALAAALEWIRNGLDQMYSMTNEHGLRHLPPSLAPHAGLISGLCKTANMALAAASIESQGDEGQE